MYPTTRSGLDILCSRDVPHIHEMILFGLDYLTFKASHEVCDTWKELLSSEAFRRKARALYFTEMLQDKEKNEVKLLSYSQNGNAEEVSRLLDPYIVDPNCVSEQGTTPLFEAILFGHAKVVKLLLDAGADPKEGHERGRTPLHWAARRGLRDVVELLLKRGADPNEVDFHGDTPLYWAAKLGDQAMVKVLLNAGAKPNPTEYPGDAALILAAKRGNKDTVKLLLNAGAEPNIYDCCGDTPLLWAATRGHTDVVQLLLDAGARRQIYRGNVKIDILVQFYPDPLHVMQFLPPQK